MRYLPVILTAILVAGCQSGGLRGPRMQMSAEQARELKLNLSGGVAADGSGSLYLTTTTTLMRYEPAPNRMEDLLNEQYGDLRDAAVTPEGVVLVLRDRELSACVAGYLVKLHDLAGKPMAVSCDRRFAYVLAAQNRGARLFRLTLSGDGKGLAQTLLTTEDKPAAICAVPGGCLVASGGNIVKVTDPDPATNEVATALLVALPERVTAVAADPGRQILYFATADMTYAWIKGQVIPILNTGSRLAWAKDTLTICRPANGQVVQIPAVSRHAERLIKQLEQGTPQGKK